MSSPIVIGLASIIPGLGFALLGKLRWSANAFFLVVGLFAAGLFVPSQFWGELCLRLAVAAWIGQIYYAVRWTSTKAKQESGEIVAPRETGIISEAPAGSSRGERLAHKSAELIRQQLQPGEHLKDA
ncbi:MAG TPA: hypothetical protein VGP99_08155, partial [Tepidisphaeraceae bacterium]|nr:hypothetical protein [Tepidisphaeraceae bacterium]